MDDNVNLVTSGADITTTVSLNDGKNLPELSGILNKVRGAALLKSGQYLMSESIQPWQRMVLPI